MIGFATLLAVASCNRYESLDYTVEKPESIAIQEDIDSYPALKSYINRSAHPNFRFGVGVNLSDYIQKGVMYRLANRNFDEIVVGYEMKHGAVVQADGSLALDKVQTLLQTAKAAGVSVYGHTLAWHANQNAKYLNGLIAPTIIPATGGPTWDVIAGANFETDDAASYQYTPGGAGSFTAVGQGANGTGRALKIVNDAVRTNDWDVQLFFKFSPAVKVGEKYKLTMDVRSDAPATYSTQAHTSPGAYKHYDFFGSISSTSTWAKYEKEITVSESMATSTTIAFNLGKTATNFYFDNITLTKFNESGGVSTGTSVIANFESDNQGKTYSMTGNSSSAVENDPKGVSGKVLHVGSAATPTSQSHPKFQVNLSNGVTLGDCVSLTLDFYGTGSTGLYGQGMRMSVDGGSLASYSSPAVFGCPDGDWGRGKIVLPISGLGLTEAQKKLTSFTIAVGSGTGSGNYYIDNIALQWKTTGDRKIEKTPAEKETIITAALNQWITSMVETCKSDVKAWDVVNEPMDDGKPFELKTAAGRTNIAADEFFWQDYMGRIMP
jgi:endo-1,4-beta-xylanase